MKDAPFAQVPASPDGEDAKAAKVKLQAVLDSLRPQAAAVPSKPRPKKAEKKAARKKQK
jgi:hypothetical protein